MANPTTIELPRIDGESARAYAARVEYVTMGAGRSLESLSQKYTKNIQLYKQWSAKYGWVESARQYDEQVAYLTVQESAEKYRADLEAHREKAMTSAKNLLALANALTRIYADALQQPQKIKGADGHMYTLHKVAVDTGTLTTIGRAMTSALDLEAHALGVDTVLGKLDSDSE